jgi:hypothetical protein
MPAAGAPAGTHSRVAHGACEARGIAAKANSSRDESHPTIVMFRPKALLVLIAVAGLGACTSTADQPAAYGSIPPPSMQLNAGDDAATVRFRGGCEVLFAPNRQLVKSSSFCTEQEKAAARRAYDAALNERDAGPEAYRDV